jgi:hypothetical protein
MQADKWNALLNDFAGSVKTNTTNKESTKKQVADSVSKWLSGSRDRDGQRVKRQKRECSRLEERERATGGEADGSLPDLHSWHGESE